MIAALRRDNLRTSAGHPCELDRALARLRAGVADERVLQVAWRDASERFRKVGQRLVEKGFGREREPLNLFAHGGDYLRMGVTEGEHAVAAEAVDVLFAVDIGEDGPCSAPLHPVEAAHFEEGKRRRVDILRVLFSDLVGQRVGVQISLHLHGSIFTARFSTRGSSGVPFFFGRSGSLSERGKLGL